MDAKIERALAAREFQTLMDKAEIAQADKDELSVQLKAWIEDGVEQIVAESEANGAIAFFVAGFRLGM